MEAYKNSIFLVFCPYNVYLRITFIQIFEKSKTHIRNRGIFFETFLNFNYLMAVSTTLVNFFIVLAKN